MGNNPSRNPFRRARLGLDDQQAVDAYKARSIWGMWWSLSEETRRRYCNEDERRWIRRYGAKLDEIACMITAPRTERQRHFLEVCEGRAEPQDERERLWLRVQIICRFPSVAERSARADIAEHRNAALEAEILQLRRDLRDAEGFSMEILEELRMHGGDFDTRRRRSICNVAWMSPKFVPIVRTMGPPAMRMLMTAATRGIPVQVLRPNPGGPGAATAYPDRSPC